MGELFVFQERSLRGGRLRRVEDASSALRLVFGREEPGPPAAATATAMPAELLVSFVAMLKPPAALR